MLRQGLGTIFELFLRTIDDIDFDELIIALQTLVQFYSEDIGPYASNLCTKLGIIFNKLIKQRDSDEELVLDEEEDTEEGLTAQSCISTIYHILKSLSDQQGDNY